MKIRKPIDKNRAGALGHFRGRTSRLVAATALCVTITMVIAACGSSTKPSASSSLNPGTSSLNKPDLTIGAITTDGVYNSSGIEDVMNSWEKWVNSHGGIAGHKVKIVSLNDGGDNGRSVADANQLISQHVVAIIDNTINDTAWASAVAGAGIPALCGAEAQASSTCFTNADFFPAGTDLVSGIFGALQATKNAGAKGLGLVYCSEYAVCSQAVPLFRADSGKLGLSLTTALAASETASDYTAQCLALKSSGANAVFPAGQPVTKIAGDCARQGYKPIWAEATWTPDELNDANLNGSVGIAPDLPWFVTSNAAGRTFHLAVGEQTISQGQLPVNLITTWAVGLLFQAAAAHVPNNPTAADITDGLYSLHGATLGGFAPPLTYVRGQGHSVSGFFPVSIKSGHFVSPNGDQVSMPPGAAPS